MIKMIPLNFLSVLCIGYFWHEPRDEVIATNLDYPEIDDYINLQKIRGTVG